MGTFGLDIFEDDLALDIKDMFQALEEEGQTVETIIEMVLEEFEDSLEDFDEGITVVLALTSLASEKGGINETLKKLLNDAASNNEYWDYLKEESEELYESRHKLLAEFLKKTS